MSRNDAALVVPVVPLWLRGVLVLGIAGTLLFFSIVPAPGSGTLRYGPLGLVPYSMWLHLLGYAGFAFVLGYTLRVRKRTITRLIGPLLGAAAFGIGIELLQATIPTRSFSTADMAVNFLGAVLGLGAWLVIERFATFWELKTSSI